MSFIKRTRHPRRNFGRSFNILNTPNSRFKSIHYRIAQSANLYLFNCNQYIMDDRLFKEVQWWKLGSKTQISIAYVSEIIVNGPLDAETGFVLWWGEQETGSGSPYPESIFPGTSFSTSGFVFCHKFEGKSKTVNSVYYLAEVSYC